MEHKKMQFLVPQYKENEETISFLLDSIESQLHIDKNDVGVIICSDGGEYVLDQKFLDKYSYDIEYVICEHRGVSATRNSALILSDAEYVMFCDADDMFYNACGLYIIFREIENGGFDSLSSTFIEESRIPETKEVFYLNREMDVTFVHGKVHRR